MTDQNTVNMEAVQDPQAKNYNIHFIAERSFLDADGTTPNSSAVLGIIERALEGAGLTPVAANCACNDGQFTSEVWIDDEPVGFQTLVDTYKQLQTRVTRYHAELYRFEQHGGLSIVSPFEQAKGSIRWGYRIVADNGQIVAGDMHQGYENRQDAIDMVVKLFGEIDMEISE